MASVREYLVKMITEVCRPHQVDLSDHSLSLFDSGLDSLDYTSVLMEIEDHFKIQVFDEDLEQLGSIDSLVTYLEPRIGA
jgi:acyl carrier protein